MHTRTQCSSLIFPWVCPAGLAQCVTVCVLSNVCINVIVYVCMYVWMSTCSSTPSRFLLRGAPDYSADTESEFHAEAHEQLRVKDLPRVPTRRLEVDSNPQPSCCKAPNIPLHHRAPQYNIVYYIIVAINEFPWPHCNNINKCVLISNEIYYVTHLLKLRPLDMIQNMKMNFFINQ